MPDLLDSSPVRPRTSSPRSTTTAARSCASATASTARELGDVDVAAGGLPGRQRPRRATSAREAIAHAAPVVAGDLDRRASATRSPRDRRRRRRDDRGGAPARAAGVPHRALPRRHRGRLGRGRASASPTSRAPSPPTAGRAAGTRSSSPSTRATAPTSSTCPNGRTRLEPAFETRVRAFLTRFRLAGYDIELRPPRFVPLDARARGLRARRPLPRRRRRGGPRRALGPRAPRRHARLLPPGELHLRRAALPEPALRRGRARRGRRLGRRPASSAATARPDAGELERGVLPIGPWEIVRLDNDPSFVEHGVLTRDRRREARHDALPCGCCEPSPR